MTDTPAEDLMSCLDCGAANHARMTKCWLCGAALDEQVVMAEVVSETIEPPQQVAQFTLAGLFITVTLGAVIMGVWTIEPGTGMLLTMLAVPALIATFVRTARKRAKGQKLGWGGKILTFFVTAAAVFGILMLLAIVAFIALFIFCLYAFSGMNI